MKKRIHIGDYRYDESNSCRSWHSSIKCNLALNDIIIKNNLIGKELEVFIREK